MTYWLTWPKLFSSKSLNSPLTSARKVSIILTMNLKKREWAPYRRVASRLRKILGEGPVMDGTLSSIDLGTSVRYQMTRKEDGRTKTIYVPQRAAAEVADWTGRWRQVRELLKELSEFSRQKFPGLLEKSGRGGSGSLSSGGEGPRKGL